MLRLIPPPLHRLLLRLAHAVRKLWWRVRRPQIEGCRVLALDGAGRLLLVRHSYMPGAWTPPSGGLRKGEGPLAAATRELREETGYELEQARPVASQLENLHGAQNQVHVVAGRLAGEPDIDGREVIEAKLFALDGLPENVPRRLAHDVKRWAAIYSNDS